MRLDQHEVLVSIHSAISSVSTKDDLFKIIIEKIKPLIGFEDESVLVAYDKAGNYYRFFDTEDRGHMNEFFRTQCGLDVMNNDPLIKDIADLNDLTIFRIDDLMRKYPGHHLLEDMKTRGYKQSFIAPIRFRDELLGTFIVHASEEKFSNEDFEMFSSVVSLLALAVRNIIDMDEIRNQKLEKDVLLNIGETIASTRDKNEMMQVINEKLQPIFGGHDITTNLCLYKPELKCAEVYMTTVPLEVHEEVVEQINQVPTFPITNNIMHDILNAKEPLIIRLEDLKDNPNNITIYNSMLHVGVKEALCAPLQTDNGTIGSLHLHSKYEDHFTERMRHIFKGICDLMAIGVSNILAYEEIENLNRQLNNEKNYLM
ncbi:MAG: GAF domain-containing protein, partial [Candidatus Kariarchaeaceae archaeon]